jgi:hypothetical protein
MLDTSTFDGADRGHLMLSKILGMDMSRIRVTFELCTVMRPRSTS